MKLQSLDQLLEEALTGVYLAWYTLPRRSTLPEVNRLRRDLAERLEQLAAAPELTAYEQALIDCAAALQTLPGVAAAGGAALAEAAAALPTAQRGGFGPLLRKTDASPQRLAALIALLRLDNPPQAIIIGMNYAPDQTPALWAALWAVLGPRLPDLPDAVRGEVEAIHTQCEEAVAAANSEKQRLAAYTAALQALEQVDAVIRVAWSLFVANKYAGEAPVYLHAALESMLDEHLAQAIPDLDLLRESAPGSEPLPDTAAMVGAEPLDAPPSPPLISPPILPPISPLPPPSLPAIEQGPSVDFFTDVRFPARVQRAEVQWLSVQLVLEAADESRVSESVPVGFAPTPPGQLPPPEYVDVRLVAPGFSEVTGVWERTMTVYPKRDSQPVVFLLSAAELGARRLSIDFLHKGRMIGSIAFRSEVVDGSSLRPSQPVELEEKLEIAPLTADVPPPADLDLRVARAAHSNELTFMLNSPLPTVPFHAQPVGQITLTEKDPQAFFTNRLQRLSELAATIPAGADTARLVQEVASLGEGLFELLLPPELRTIYWEQIKPLVESGVIKTLLINSDEPWIPWELIKPYRWDDANDTDETAAFLVEQFTLSRWLARPLPAGVAVKQVALVMPELDLTNVQEEKAFFDDLAQQRHIQLQGPLQSRDEVLDSLRAGSFQLLHFATHGSFDAENAQQSELSLSDGSLTPADLMGSDLRGMRAAHPLVFLNACHSGQVALSLTGLGGWAEKFFHEARASAFVGTLWEVSDDLAADFARLFYTGLADGKPLGEALRAARLQIRDSQPANPTWLAYALYGDPNAQVSFGG